jgi:hypothetical protein
MTGSEWVTLFFCESVPRFFCTVIQCRKKPERKEHKMSVEEEVFSNADLARRLIAMGAPEILTASRSIRDAHQPCARFYEGAKVLGCNTRTDEERACLRSIGGAESTLCTGEYHVTSMNKDGPCRRASLPQPW